MGSRRFLILIGLLLLTDALRVIACYAFVTDFPTYVDVAVVTFWQSLTWGSR